MPQFQKHCRWAEDEEILDFAHEAVGIIGDDAVNIQILDMFPFTHFIDGPGENLGSPRARA